MTCDQLCSLTLVFSDLSRVQGDTGGHVCKVSRVCVYVRTRPPGVQPGVGGAFDAAQRPVLVM